MSTMYDLTVKNEMGKTIKILRRDVGKSRREIAFGLCSVSVLQRLEEGERFADKKLIDALIQRLGKSSDKFEFLLGKEEYERNKKRLEIERAFEKREYNKCRELLKEFSEKCKKGDTLNWQYIEKMKFLLGDLEYKTLDEAEELILNMLCKTSPDFCLERMEERLLCTEECSLIYLLALTEIEFKNFKKAKMILVKLIVYLEYHFHDEEERIKLYPQIAYSLSKCYEYYEEYTQEKKVAEKAIELLEKNGRIYLLAELLECYKSGFLGEKGFRLTLTEEEYEMCKRWETQIEVLREIQEEYGDIYSGTEANTIFHNYGGQEVNLIHEVFGKKRRIKGLTQEKLSYGICEPETLSRLLNGRQMPNQKTFRMLAKCLEVDSERCRPYLSVKDYEVYEKQRKLGDYLQKKEYDLAERLFQEVEKELPQNIARNRQFCKMIRTNIESRLGRINWEERLKYLEEAITYTIPDYPNISIKQWPLCRQEIVLLNNIAVTYMRLEETEKALSIFRDMMEYYESSEVDCSHRIEGMIMTIFNYVEWLGNLKKYEEALPLYEMAIKMSVDVGRGKFLSGLLYGKAWVLKKISENNIGICQKYCRQAYYMAELMKEEKNKNFILKYGMLNFDSFLV